MNTMNAGFWVMTSGESDSSPNGCEKRVAHNRERVRNKRRVLKMKHRFTRRPTPRLATEIRDSWAEGASTLMTCVEISSAKACMTSKVILSQ